MELSLADVFAARKRVSPYIRRTPLLRIPALDKAMGCEVYIKPENLQYTGSFKLRGAASRLTLLTNEEKIRGVITASSGNHAKALAYAAQKLCIKALIVMPTNCNPAKLAGVRSYGAKVLFEGQTSSDRNAKARQLAAEDGYVLVHSHADFYVKAGQGTIALEVLEDCPDLNAIVSPVGGGGLVSGVAIVAKTLNPAIRVVGAEPKNAARYAASRAAAHPENIKIFPTIADGTRCDHADPQNFLTIEKYVDDLVSAEEKDIRRAMKLVIEEAKIVAEPSSVLGIASAMNGSLRFNKNDKVCFIVTGGNNDPNLLSQVLTEHI
jgi:threonine dehydratase